MGELTGRVAIVTGASQGIGRAIVRLLTAQGANVVATARRAGPLDALADELRDGPGQVHCVAADATDADTARRVVDAAVSQFGQLDILVNNVGGPHPIGKFDELRNEDWRNAFQLNVITVVDFSREAIPWLRKSQAGRIINISSIMGVEPGELNPHYSASKAAVINLSKHLANLLAPDRIGVNVICPGQVNTEHRGELANYMSQSHGISLDDATRLIDTQGAARIPLGRIGEADDVAHLVGFLASDRAAWITGARFDVNGGKTRSAF